MDVSSTTQEPVTTQEQKVFTITEVSRMGGIARARKLGKRRLAAACAHASRIRWRRWRKAQHELRKQSTPDEAA